MAAVVRRPVIVLTRTVRLDSGKPVELGVAMPAARLGDIFAQQNFPAGWTGVVLDARHAIVARNRNQDKYVGMRATASTQRRFGAADAGTFERRTRDGIESVAAWSRSPLTRWTFVVAAPTDQLAAGAHASLIEGVLVAIIMLGAGLFATIPVSRSIAGPIDRLRANAAALGNRRPMVPLDTRFAELDAVQAVLEETSVALRSHEQELQSLNEALERRVIERTRELAEATESLIQAQKMEAIGRLTGGIAHDFNNLLTAVIGNLDLVERNTTDERNLRRLGSARKAAERGARLTSQLLAFSRRQQLHAETIDINAAIEQALVLIESSLGGGVHVECRPAEALWPALADPTQFDLILLNLAINARDAMPDGGLISIATANARIGDGAAGPEDPAPGEYVTVMVADTGTGMAPDVRARIFEPFFTTKGAGQGTGLGLPQVLGILKQLNGGIRIETQPGQGTKMTIFLPRSHAAIASTVPAPASAAFCVEGTQVLLVDDDPDVRGVALSMLQDLGCRVIDAPDGQQALALLASSDAAGIDFALIDYAMPGMNGAELAARIRAERPAIPIILMSGYADIDKLASLWSGPLLAKPFTATMLSARMQETVSLHGAT